jgi:hypothetical protein
MVDIHSFKSLVPVLIHGSDGSNGLRPQTADRSVGVAAEC